MLDHRELIEHGSHFRRQICYVSSIEQLFTPRQTDKRKKTDDRSTIHPDSSTHKRIRVSEELISLFRRSSLVVSAVVPQSRNCVFTILSYCCSTNAEIIIRLEFIPLRMGEGGSNCSTPTPVPDRVLVTDGGVTAAPQVSPFFETPNRPSRCSKALRRCATDDERITSVA